jgi:hypothetical protein
MLAYRATRHLGRSDDRPASGVIGLTFSRKNAQEAQTGPNQKRLFSDIAPFVCVLLCIFAAIEFIRELLRG